MTSDSDWAESGPEPKDEQERLRRVLGFPAPVESATAFTRRTEPSQQPAPPPPAPPPTQAPAAPPAPDDSEEVSLRFDQLNTRISAIAGLVETLFDRVGERSDGSLTAAELADIAARMLRLIEERLDEHHDTIEQAITAAVAQSGAGVVVADGAAVPPPDLSGVEERLDRYRERIEDAISVLAERAAATSAGSQSAEQSVDLSLIEQRLERLDARIDQALASLAERGASPVEGTPASELGLIDDHLALLARKLIDVENMIGERQLLPSDVRDDVRRLENYVAEMRDAILDRPVVVAEADTASIDVERLLEVQRLASERQGLDPVLVDQLTVQLEQASSGMAQKVDELLASRMQRFEALSQSMMLLVGDPVDALTDKLSHLAKAQDASPTVLQSIGEVAQIQGQLAAAIASLRQEAAERDALLHEILQRLS